MVHSRVAADPVSLFLRKNTFHCKSLNANLTSSECADRQVREVEMKMFGRKILSNDSLFDRFCRSGCCAVGLVHLRKHRYKEWLLRLKEARKRVAPCKQLAGGNAATV